MRKDKVTNGEYKVSWIIDVPASSPREAAKSAREVMYDLKKEDNLATVFLVESPDGSTNIIDLLGE